jgi:isopenicillin-N N-acyltransferase like protein
VYPRVKVKGNPRERGRSYGEQARHRIAVTQAGYEKAFRELAGIGWSQAAEAALQFTEPVERHAPQVMEELRGIAEGAGMSLGDILAMNARTEVIWAATARQADAQRASLAHECTALALLSSRTASGLPLAAQSWDWLVHCFDSAVVLEVEQPGELPNFVTAVEAGLLAKVSLNSAGITVLTNALVTSADRGAPGIPFHVMLRLLADCQTVTDALRLVQTLPRSSSANYMIVSGDDAAVNIEAAPGDYTQVSWQLPQAGVLAHTNHFLDLPHGISDVSAYAMPDSIVRLSRATAVLSADGALWDVDRLVELLEDHADWPNSICCHPDPRDEGPMQWATVLAVATSPAERRFWLASGNPCTSRFEEVLFGGLLQKETSLGVARAEATRLAQACA